MKLKIEKYLKKNRLKLDVDEPDDDLIWQGIKSGLKEKNQFIPSWFWKVAAVFFLVFFTTYVVINENKQKQVFIITLSDLSKSLGEQEAGLKQQVDIKWQEVQSKMTNKNIDIQFLLKEYKELDKIYSTYQNDLGKTPDNERIIRAMLDQYEKKIQLLNRLLLEIEKQKNHEKSITL